MTIAHDAHPAASALKRWWHRPAGWPWLVRHEIRLAWRSMGFKRSSVTPYIFGLAWVTMHCIAVVTVWGLDKAGEMGHRVPPHIIPWVGILFWVMFTIVLSQTLAHAVEAFFSRGDTDLLLASPIDSRVVLAVRAVGIALSGMLLPILLVLPFAHAGLIVGKWSLLAIYPAIVGLCLTAAAAGVVISMGLVHAVGARRAKTWVQVMGAVIGAFFFLLTQIQNVLGRGTRERLAAWFTAHRADGGFFANDSLLWWPARGFMGEWLLAMGFLLASAVVFALVVRATHRRYVEGTQEGASAPRSARPSVAAVAERGRGVLGRVFSPLAATTLMKEWRLITRDPQLISQTLLQLLYLIPMFFLALRGNTESAAFLVGGIVVLIAMLVGNLAWITVAAEDAPDLLGASPVSAFRLRTYKALAAVLPALMLVVPVVVYWLVVNPAAALVLAVFASAAAFSTAGTYVFMPRVANRRDIAKRGNNNPFLSILELVSAAGWAAMAAGFLYRWWLIPVGLPFALAGILYAYWGGRLERKTGKFL
jgi:ABC-2 type transport system permease protein